MQPGERDEGQVHGVQHQLDAHEHHERVPADENADAADHEQYRGERDIVRRAYHRSSESSEPGSAARSEAARPESTTSPPMASSRAIARLASTPLTDSRDIEPSGSRAGVSTELCSA